MSTNNPSDYPVYAEQPYPVPSHYSVDHTAPYGRDPETGKPLSNKSALAAGCLQLFFGMFGIGRFYIGSFGIGLTQLGLSVLGLLTSIVLIGLLILPIVGLWVFIDAILMFTGVVKDGKGRKLR